ncbi:substrate-binding periplasmic protein [Pseudoalteromonas luteoviolacea]|uniref:ABC-type amino acid transport/signal transduction system, periplasmic component/domain protein n=1 Tax=Pseudoalteromonas luteoviolacea (strain 2ta16) TaxID=1353533 RepID=V4HIK0_PSEL2|nr:ABC transporter substrate-binding protein [Pseudoalteromonas luteoviolacea]ESP90630.1 ABC-type amino acid transport/signal transduction system, periplasmic component/domain protein [Pseudoalteromonas luteoviolacea 2ta16]KZN41795.1 hypothetical protein N483_14080 [Pseudoalteromonas luteoviolacea NCIMB 1944]
MKYYLMMILFYFSLPCAPSSGEKITLYTEEFPPYNFSQQNEIKGINTEVVMEACRVSGIDCELVLLPWARAMKNTKLNKNSGLFSTSRTPAREDKFKWVGPLVYSVTCFYKLKENKDLIIHSTDDLKHFTIGLMRLDIYQLVFDDLQLKEGIHYLTFAEKHQEMELFKKGKLDLIIGSSVTLGAQLKKAGLTFSDVEPVFVLEHRSLKGNYLAMNKNIDDVIVKKLQRSIDYLKQNLHVDTIVEQYLPYPNQVYKSHAKRLEQCSGKTTIY